MSKEIPLNSDVREKFSNIYDRVFRSKDKITLEESINILKYIKDLPPFIEATDFQIPVILSKAFQKITTVYRIANPLKSPEETAESPESILKKVSESFSPSAIKKMVEISDSDTIQIYHNIFKEIEKSQENKKFISELMLAVREKQDEDLLKVLCKDKSFKKDYKQHFPKKALSLKGAFLPILKIFKGKKKNNSQELSNNDPIIKSNKDKTINKKFIKNDPESFSISKLQDAIGLMHIKSVDIKKTITMNFLEFVPIILNNIEKIGGLEEYTTHQGKVNIDIALQSTFKTVLEVYQKEGANSPKLAELLKPFATKEGVNGTSKAMEKMVEVSDKDTIVQYYKIFREKGEKSLADNLINTLEVYGKNELKTELDKLSKEYDKVKNLKALQANNILSDYKPLIKNNDKDSLNTLFDRVKEAKDPELIALLYKDSAFKKDFKASYTEYIKADQAVKDAKKRLFKKPEPGSLIKAYKAYKAVKDDKNKMKKAIKLQMPQALVKKSIPSRNKNMSSNY